MIITYIIPNQRLIAKLSDIEEVWKIMDLTLADLKNYLDHPKQEVMVNLFGKHNDP